jgi:hypothetical protein
MPKTLSIHEKINLRSWMKRYKNVGIDQSVLLRLPVAMIPRIVYALSGRNMSNTYFLNSQATRLKA